MKLHLPSGLRKALLACLAALAAHSVPFTVATGAAFATSGALVSFLLGQQAIAADADGEDDEEDEITPFAIDGDWASAPQITSGDSWNSFFSTTGQNAAGAKVAIDTSSAEGGIDLGNTARTISADMWIEKFEIASLGADLTFSGAVYGAGDFTTAASVTGRTFTINGDWSNYTGNINVGSNDIVVNGGKSLSGNEIQGKMFKLGGNNIVVSVNEMRFSQLESNNPSSVTFNAGGNGTSNIFFSSAADAVSIIRNNVTVTLNNGVTLTVQDTGATTFSVFNSGRVVLNSGSKWVVATTAAMNINEATLTVNSGATFDIQGSLSSSSATKGIISLAGDLKVTGTASVGSITGGGTITLSGSGDLSVGNAWSFGGSVTVNGGALHLKGATNTLTGLAGSGGTVEVGANSTLTLNGTTTYTGRLSLLSGAKLVVAGDGLAFSDDGLELSMAANSSLVIGSGSEGLLSLAGVSSAIDNLKIFIDFNLLALESGSFSLFAEQGVPAWITNENWQNYIDFLVSGDKISYNDGVLTWDVLRDGGQNIEWQGGNVTWTIGGDGWMNGSNEDVFVTGDNVTFSGNNGNITLGDNISVGSMTVSGAYGLTFGTHTLTVGGNLTIGSGASLEIAGDDTYSKLAIQNDGHINIEHGGTLIMTFSAQGSGMNALLSRIAVTGSGDESATLEIKRSGGSLGNANPAITINNENLRVRLHTLTNNGNNSYAEYYNLNLMTEVGLVMYETCLNGTENKIGRLTVAGTENGKLVLEDGAHLTIGGEKTSGGKWGDSELNNFIDLRSNTVLTLGSNLTVKGVKQNTTTKTGQSIIAQEEFNANLTINSNGNYDFNGSINLNGGTLTKAGTGNNYQSILGGLTAGTVNINNGTLILSGTLNINNLNASAGTGLVLRNESLVLYQGDTSELNSVKVSMTDAWLSVVDGSVITLGSDLDVSGVACYGYGSSTIGTIQAVEGQEVRLIIHGGTGSNENMHSNTLTLGERVTLVMEAKTGSSNLQKIQGATIHGNVEVNGGTLRFTWTDSSIGGTLSGNGGTLNVDSGANLTLTGGGTYGGTLYINGEADVTGQNAHTGKSSLLLGASLEVANLTAGTEERNAVGVTNSVNVDGGDTVDLTVNMSGNQSFGANKLTLNKGVILVKKGAGTWTVTDGLKITSGLRVEEGTYALDALTLSASYGVTLDGGTLSFSKEQTSTQLASKYTFGTLTIGTGNGTLNLGTQTANTHREVEFDKLTGSGNLNVGTLTGSSGTHYQRLTFTNVEDFHGTVSGRYSGNEQYSHVRINHVNQTTEKHAQFNLGVYSTDFRFEGAGALTLTTLTVLGGDSGKLYMNYDGAFNYNDIILGSEISLVYTYAGENSQSKVISLALEDVLDKRLKLDISGVDQTYREAGINLGIALGDSDQKVEDLQTQFALSGLTGSWYLEDRGGVLYLVAGELAKVESEWDEKWGSVGGLTGAPDSMVAQDKEFGSTTTGNAHIWVLSADGNQRGEVYLNGGGYKNGNAIVLGGALYDAGSEAGSLTDRVSWIRMNDGNYHILVGGSSCLAFATDTEAEEAAGGFFANSHIQVQGGTVDYIVGGNHINNSSFTFQGNSYISVMDGATVMGGIVGGSTLTKGSNNESVFAFDGNTNIFIYTVLSNPGANYTFKGMWDGTESAGTGGNGKNDDGTQSMYGAAFTAAFDGSERRAVRTVCTARRSLPS